MREEMYIVETETKYEIVRAKDKQSAADTVSPDPDSNSLVQSVTRADSITFFKSNETGLSQGPYLRLNGFRRGLQRWIDDRLAWVKRRHDRAAEVSDGGGQ
jgi:hypothetical protein